MNQPADRGAEVASFSGLTDFLEIDEPSVNIGIDKPDPELVADIHTGVAVEQTSFYRRFEDTYPCPFVCCSRTNRVECFSDSR